jgi:hypothetical protein
VDQVPDLFDEADARQSDFDLEIGFLSAKERPPCSSWL